MISQQIKTDNSRFDLKIAIRKNCVGDKTRLNILDCFAGRGKCWHSIPGHNVIGLDIKKTNGNLIGDNVKFLKGMDLNKFDVIDLDAYGVPYRQLKIIFKKNFRGFVIATFIQSIFGVLPIKMLEDIGYTKEMIRKSRTLFNVNGFGKFKLWLALNGVKKIRYLNSSRKYYLYFSL